MMWFSSFFKKKKAFYKAYYELPFAVRGSRNIQYYKTNYDSIYLIEFIKKIDVKKRCKEICDLLIKNQSRYMAVAQKLHPPVEGAILLPWQLVGIIHILEADGNWKCNLHNGERWDKVTKLVPKGRGPFKDWESAAVDALFDLMKMCKNTSVYEILRLAELHNGLGYCNRGKASPYIFSGTNIGVGVGKYTSDGKYDPNAVSEQIGAAAVLYYGEINKYWTLNKEV